MSGTAQQKKPRVVFVDDEQRVLNSMRVRFRREYDLHLTTLGSEALAMLEEHEIDVIVAPRVGPRRRGTSQQHQAARDQVEVGRAGRAFNAGRSQATAVQQYQGAAGAESRRQAIMGVKKNKRAL